MRFFLTLLGSIAVSVGCSSSTATTPAGTSVPSSPGTTQEQPAPSCGEAGTPLLGANYDVAKSRFAFGSTPTEEKSAQGTRWIGSDGVIAIFASGYTLGVMNSGAPATDRPGWSASDPTEHVKEYFVAMGISACQIGNVNINASGGGGGATTPGAPVTPAPSSTTIILSRVVDNIAVDSTAYARFNDQDKTTNESFYWPTIPADVIASARAFRDELNTPAGLAAYKAKLPAEAQGAGTISIHTNGRMPKPNAPFVFAAIAAYDTMFGTQSPVSFDHDGKMLEPGAW